MITIKRLFHFLWKIRFGKIGNNSWISPKGVFMHPKQIQIGSNVFIGHGATISCTAGLSIGDGVTIGPGVTIMGGDHNYRIVGKRIHEVTTGGINMPVIIEDDVWIGASTTILKGVTVGEGSIVGAGSIVTKSIQPYSIVAGNPARRIGSRFNDEQLKTHLRQVRSKYRIDDLTGDGK
ncbi:MAG: acyltransferase [Pseudomonadota bacterium]